MSDLKQTVGEVTLLEWSGWSETWDRGLFHSYGAATLKKRDINVLKFVDGKLAMRTTKWDAIASHPASPYLGLLGYKMRPKSSERNKKTYEQNPDVFFNILTVGGLPAVLDVSAMAVFLTVMYTKANRDKEASNKALSMAWEVATTAGYTAGMFNPYIFVLTLLADVTKSLADSLLYSDVQSLRDMQAHMQALEGYLVDIPPDVKPDSDDSTSLYGRFLACSWIAYLLAMGSWGDDDMGDYLPANSVIEGSVEYDGRMVTVTERGLSQEYRFKYKVPEMYNKWCDAFVGENDALLAIPTYLANLEESEMAAWDYAKMTFDRRFGIALWENLSLQLRHTPETMFSIK
jgi:hypothetical protein